MSRSYFSSTLAVLLSTLALTACGGSDDSTPASPTNGGSNTGENTDTDSGTNPNPGTDTDSGTNPNPGTDTDSGTDPNPGTDTDSGTDPNPGNGTGLDPNGGPSHLKLSFTDARMNLNETGGDPSTLGILVIDSAVPDPPAVFETADGWNSATGVITAPKEALVFPSKTIQLAVTKPIATTVDAKIEFGAISDITGSYDPGTGALNLDLQVHALINVNALVDTMICDVTPIQLHLSTTGGTLSFPGDTKSNPARPAQDWPASAFQPNGGATAGAISYLWDSLPQSTVVKNAIIPGATCPDAVDPMLGGKGGLWMSGTVTR